MPPHLPSPIRWGILGAGKVAWDFAEGLRSVADAQLVAVGSRTLSKAEALAGAFGAARCHADYRSLVDDENIDVVYVATPAALHRDHCLQALSAGKPVLCEKPFTTTAAEAREVIACARQAKLFCMEAMWMRFLPAMIRVRELLEQRAIGDIRLLTADLGFAAPRDPQSRLFDAQLGGGALLDLGIYPLSLAFALLGRPERVSGQATIGSTGVDEEVAAVLGYSGGALAVLTASLTGNLPCEARLVGTRGCIGIHAPLYRPHRLSIRTHAEPASVEAHLSRSGGGLMSQLKRSPSLRALYFRLEGLLRPLREGRPTSIVVPFVGNGYNYEAEEVCRCLRAGDTESRIIPLDETLAILETVDRIRAQWASPAVGR